MPNVSHLQFFGGGYEIAGRKMQGECRFSWISSACLPAPLERLQARLKYDFQMKEKCDHAPSILSPSISTTLKNKN